MKAVSSLLETRKALFMCAASCQGGNSDAGKVASEILGVPFPIRMEPLRQAAIAEGLDPEELWPWYIDMLKKKNRL